MSKLTDSDWLFNGRHFDREVILLCARWYPRSKLRLRDLKAALIGQLPCSKRQTRALPAQPCRGRLSAGFFGL
uniref:hypothetical protein n=1 Tax=Paraburkholderia fungorum TaxID=134537 RepID=UPI0038BCDF54